MSEGKMRIFLCIANNLRIIKAYIYKPLADLFIKRWNVENTNDKCHLEVYVVDQFLNDWNEDKKEQKEVLEGLIL